MDFSTLLNGHLISRVLIFQEYNEKYYRFKGGGPPYYDLLCSIFVKTIATKEYGHASTITPPNSYEGDCRFDLDNAALIVDLSDGDGASHASKEDKEVKAFKIRLDDMMGKVHSIKDGVSRRSYASSAKMDPIEVAMNKLNELNAELDVPEDRGVDIDNGFMEDMNDSFMEGMDAYDIDDDDIWVDEIELDDMPMDELGLDNLDYTYEHWYDTLEQSYDHTIEPDADVGDNGDDNDMDDVMVDLTLYEMELKIWDCN
ncbi:hypothetical protein FH972_015132 [Carpinus fangiana]|uniref:Uncharacterized protein n=1 Tax=Carpinus fangiana TaxID=176857 RepID=A0A5N6RBR3_9ROSI|nr:hypothetical protein FH972_015132 [Carpinus fangiana]